MKRAFRIFSVLLILVFNSCHNNRFKADTSGIKTDLKIIRFEQELFSIPSDNFENGLKQLQKENEEFFPIFTYKMIKIGGIGDSTFLGLAHTFVTDTMILNVKKLVDDKFSDFDKTGKELNKAFARYKYFFPGKSIPKIYTCISGFNQSVVTSTNIIGISLEKYLGPGCRYYDLLGLPAYKQQKMYKEKLVSDVVYALGITEFENNDPANTLLSNMVYQGKLMVLADAILPGLHDTLKIGFTAKQLDWCKHNEFQMWANLIENKRLFVSNRMDIKRFIDEAPYTNGFPPESPGRAGVWIGWQIVRKYMEKHPEVTLPELMAINNSQKILNDSGYYPDK